jgi:hypothetical protein
MAGIPFLIVRSNQKPLEGCEHPRDRGSKGIIEYILTMIDKVLQDHLIRPFAQNAFNPQLQAPEHWNSAVDLAWNGIAVEVQARRIRILCLKPCQEIAIEGNTPGVAGCVKRCRGRPEYRCCERMG